MWQKGCLSPCLLGAALVSTVATQAWIVHRPRKGGSMPSFPTMSGTQG